MIKINKIKNRFKPLTTEVTINASTMMITRSAIKIPLQFR